MSTLRDVSRFADAERSIKLVDYAYEHSTPLPKSITEFRHQAASHYRSAMLTSDFQSQFHTLLVNMIGAKRILEIGVYLGYSGLVWSHAVGPDGHVTGLEYSAEYAKIAKDALDAEGVKNVEILIGPAEETLRTLAPSEPYDLVFIDADKTGYEGYLKQLLAASQPDAANRLLRPGSLILSDNAVLSGAVVWGADEGSTTDASVEAIRVYNKYIALEKRLQAVLLPLWDGLSVARLID